MSRSGANYNRNDSSGDVFSWVAVIICLIAFWPLGLFMLLKKISSSTKGYTPSGSAFRDRQAPPRYGSASQSAYRRPYANPNYRPAPPVRQPREADSGTAQNQPHQTGSAAGGGYQTYQNGAVRQPYYQADTAGRSKAPDEKKSDASANRKQTSAKGLAVALTVLTVLISLIGIIFLSSGISALAVAGMTAANLGMTIFGGFSLIGAAILGVIRGTVLKHVNRFNRYAAVIGDREVMSVSEIAKAMGEPVKKTRKTLQTIIDNGYFGEHAYIDNGLDSFVVSHEAAEKARCGTDAAQTSGTQKTESSGASGSANQYVAIINELHMLCSQTSDPAICGKIERIEALTAKIFRIVEENPEKLPQIRRFMNYYLPTTMKLLHSYQTLERQGISGENITSAKQDIERVLDTLAAGYEQQLDNLFKADKLDISAEVNVLENLMEQDGLTNDGGIMRTAGGN